MKQPRYFLAFLLAPAAPALIFGLLQLFVDDMLVQRLVLACVALSYPSAMVLGIPVYLFARECGWTKWWQLVMQFALLGGAVPFILLILFLATGSSVHGLGTSDVGITMIRLATAADWLQAFLVGSLLGAIVGATFAFILSWPRRRASQNASDRKHCSSAMRHP